jgi:hypothetical protein
MFKILIPAVASLGLVAFAAKTQPVVSAPAAPPAADAMAWHLSQEGDMAKLAYGVANSDQLAMMVTCAPGDATAAVYGDVHPVSAEAESEAPMDEARIALSDANLHDLAAKGSMRVVGEGGAFLVRASAQEQRGIGQFLNYCINKTA